MVGINPYISFRGNCREAIEFYRQALSAEVLFVQTMGDAPMKGMGPDDNIMHASIRVGGSVIMMSDGAAADPASSAEDKISLALGLSDAQEANRLFGNLAEGGSVTMPIAKTYWAEAFGMLTDKFGVRWMVNCETRGGA